MIAALPIGTVGQYLTIAAVLLGSWLIYRGGGGGALATLETANRILVRRVEELERQGKVDTAMIAELRGRTDVTLALAPLVQASEAHEVRAQQRHERSLVVLEMIASRLGPDNGHGKA